MFNKPTKEQLSLISALYETEHIPLKDKPVYLHFQIGASDWYVMEFDGNDTFWGFAILNSDYEMAEFGYFSFHELANIRVKGVFEIENDSFWQIRPACRIERICEAQGWTLPEDQGILEMECPCCKKIVSSDSTSNKIQCNECKIIILQRHINSTSSEGLAHGLYS